MSQKGNESSEPTTQIFVSFQGGYYVFFWVAHFVSFFVALFQGHYSIGLQQLLQAEEAEAGQVLRENGTIFVQRDTVLKKLGFVGVVGSLGLVFIYSI